MSPVAKLRNIKKNLISIQVTWIQETKKQFNFMSLILKLPNIKKNHSVSYTYKSVDGGATSSAVIF
jgi:uncharacterized metal-binding protein